MLTSDHELLHQISARQSSALAELYDRHHKRLFALAVSQTRCTESAEVVMEELFAEIWQAPKILASSAIIGEDMLRMILRKVGSPTLPELRPS